MNENIPGRKRTVHPPGNGQIILITGDRRAGKTTLCDAVIRLAGAEGWDVGGILSRAVFVDGQKTGIMAVDARTNEKKELAHLRQDEEEILCAADAMPWIFDETCFAWGNRVLRMAVPCDLLVVDELGPLEWKKLTGWVDGLTVIDERRYGAALVTVRPSLLEQVAQHCDPAAVITVEQDQPLPVDRLVQTIETILTSAGRTPS